MKKALISLFFICLFAFPALADFTVDSISVYGEAGTNGKTEVSSTIVLTFTSAQDEVTIPLPDEDVSRVSVSSYRHTVQETENGTNLKVTNRGGFMGTHTFQVSYQLPAFSDDGGDADLYRLNVLSSRWARDIGSVAVQLKLPESQTVLPEDFVMAPVILSGYYGEMDPVDAPLDVAGTMISGTVSSRMAYDSLSVEVSLPDGYFRVRSTSIPMISITWFCLAMVALTLLCMLYWRLKLRTPPVSYSARLLAPEGILPYQLPQILDGTTCDMAALILTWANLGYVSLGYSKNRQVILRKNMTMGSERSVAEQRLFARIFSTRSRVLATPGRFSGAAGQFRAASRKSLARTIYDPKGGNPVLIQLPCRFLLAAGTGYLVYQMLPEGGGFLVLAILAGMVGFIYSMYLHTALATWKARREFSLKSAVLVLLAGLLIYLGLLSGAFLETTVGIFACSFSAIATAAGPRRSDLGRDILAQTKGCRRFYRQVSWQHLRRYTARNQRFFQLQLPNAVALNSDKAFAARFERLTIPRPEWLPGAKRTHWSAQALQKQLSPMIQKLREAFR